MHHVCTAYCPAVPASLVLAVVALAASPAAKQLLDPAGIEAWVLYSASHKAEGCYKVDNRSVYAKGGWCVCR